MIKVKRRRYGGCAMKECVLAWGDIPLCLKGRRLKSALEAIDDRSRFAKPNRRWKKSKDCDHISGL